MTCPRCQGLMCKELATERKSRPILLWACHLCGERLDDTIKIHRMFYTRETMQQRNERILREIGFALNAKEKQCQH